MLLAKDCRHERYKSQFTAKSLYFVNCFTYIHTKTTTEALIGEVMLKHAVDQIAAALFTAVLAGSAALL